MLEYAPIMPEFHYLLLPYSNDFAGKIDASLTIELVTTLLEQSLLAHDHALCFVNLLTTCHWSEYGSHTCIWYNDFTVYMYS